MRKKRLERREKIDDMAEWFSSHLELVLGADRELVAPSDVGEKAKVQHGARESRGDRDEIPVSGEGDTARVQDIRQHRAGDQGESLDLVNGYLDE